METLNYFVKVNGTMNAAFAEMGAADEWVDIICGNLTTENATIVEVVDKFGNILTRFDETGQQTI